MLKLQASEFVLPKAVETLGDDACGYSVIDNTLLIAVLCDGVGSARKGGSAARQTVKFFIDQFKTRPKAWSIEKSLTVFTQHINRMLFKESMTQYEQIELLTTLCVAVIEGRKLYTLHLGDSRIYLQTKDGILTQLTHDHNVDDEYMSHVLTQACGLSEHVEPEIKITDINEGDTLVLCSDGLTALNDDIEISNQIKRGISAKLIVNAAAHGHKDNDRDDISMQVFRIETLDALHDIKNLELPIPTTLHKNDIIDGFTLAEAMMAHQRIWKVLKGDTTYVMKFPMMADDEQSLDEFVREAWYAKQIKHIAFGEAWVPDERSSRYYLMELIEGTNLLNYLKEKTLSVDSVIELAKFLHKAEAHLLHLGLVHGDIKPENIIVHKNEKAGVTFKMVDFGSIVEIFSTASRAGTPTYLAPERFSESAINEASEIFAIGVTLYWALTGKFPYGEIEPFQTPNFKMAKFPSKYNKNVPDWLDAVLMRAIAIQKDERYQHYSEFIYELNHPENVKPFFPKNATFMERSPVLFYKTAFILMLILNIILVIYFNS